MSRRTETPLRAYRRISQVRLLTKGIHAEARNGDFVDLRSEILQWTGQDSFVFFFVDPTGWKEIGIATLRPLLQRPHSEFLVNFMYDFINRTMSMAEWQRDMKELLGGLVELNGLDPAQREDRILKTYRSHVKRCVPESNWGYP